MASTARAAHHPLAPLVWPIIPLLRATRDSDLSVRQSALAALDSLGSAGITVAVTVLMQAAVGAGDPEAQGDREGMAEGWTERTLGRFMLHAGLANDSGAGSGGR